MHHSLFSATLADLRARVGDRAAIRLGEAGALLGFSVATTHKKHCLGTFPVPVLRDAGTAPTVSIYALAAHLSGLAEVPVVSAAPACSSAASPSRVGRPTRAEQREAARSGITVRELRRRGAGGRHG